MIKKYEEFFEYLYTKEDFYKKVDHDKFLWGDSLDGSFTDHEIDIIKKISVDNNIKYYIGNNHLIGLAKFAKTFYFKKYPYEWYSVLVNNNMGDMPEKEYYHCDQFEGLLKFIKNEVIV